MEAMVAERVDAGQALEECLDVNAGRQRRDAALFPDPLGEDDDGDEVVITTRRAIGRVALVATETANHFQREAVDEEPMAWMWTPRAIFGGATAIDACLERDSCLRGVILHGLGLGMDADREAVDALIATDGDDFEEHEFRYLCGDRFSGRAASRKGGLAGRCGCDSTPRRSSTRGTTG